MRTLVVDASVAVKWFLPEVGSERAQALLDSDGFRLVAPELLLAEVGNVFWKRCRRGELTAEQVLECIGILTSAPLAWCPVRPLARHAVRVAVDTGRTVYDSIYLCTALLHRTVVVTADERFRNGLRHSPFEQTVILLDDLPLI